MSEIQQDDSLVSLYGEALDYAERMKSPLTTLHFLLAYFSAPCEAATIFETLNISYKDVAKTYNSMVKNAKLSDSVVSEAPDTVKMLEQNAKKWCLNSAQPVNPTHFLAAMTNLRNTVAYRIFDKLGVVTNLRLAALSHINEPTKKALNRAEEMKRESTRVSFATTDVRKENQIEAGEKSGSDISAISLFGRNLTKAALEGKIDPVFGRSREIEAIIDILGRKNSNNPMIIGPAGSGKTAIVEAVALRQKNGLLPGIEIWELNVSSLVGGTEYRGSLEKRISELLDFVEKNRESIIVFIDEIHLLFSSGNDSIANMLKPALSRGGFPLIGATTTEEFNRFIAKDPAMERRFSIVKVEEPKGDDLFSIVVNAAKTLENYHGVSFGDETFIKNAITLSNRYISGKSQPDKVLSMLDTLGSILKREQKQTADSDDLIYFVSNKTGIPPENLLIDTAKIVNALPKVLDRSIIGQKGAKERITRLFARKFTNKPPFKPLASMIFAGPTGTGKTETAKKLASFFFGSEERMVVLDMSEFQEAHSVSKLIGAPPGYSGYEEGGKLTEAFRREPYQLLLLDEIEKANPKVLTLLLQILEEGRVSDTRGWTADMSESIIIMTTNLGAELFSAGRIGFGESANGGKEAEIVNKIEGFLSPELTNRIDEIILFKPFSDDEFLQLASIYLDEAVKKTAEFVSGKVIFEDKNAAAAFICSRLTARDRLMGARAVKRAVGKFFEGAFLEEFYKNSETNADFVCSVAENKMVFSGKR
ncbi:ATP-dependent Clp protease ATP-binding subunit [bacterium]|nr:ATP-dependent Clp protease ATP-binding subunit [bacterium]